MTRHPLVYDAWILAAARDFEVPAELIAAVIETESHFDPTAVNTADPGSAWGLMQLLPETAHFMGWPGTDARELLDPLTNIRLGAQYLAYQLHRYNGSLPDAVSAYNAGRTLRRTDGSFGNAAYVDRVGSALSSVGTSYALLTKKQSQGPATAGSAGGVVANASAISGLPAFAYVLFGLILYFIRGARGRA